MIPDMAALPFVSVSQINHWHNQPDNLRLDIIISNSLRFDIAAARL